MRIIRFLRLTGSTINLIVDAASSIGQIWVEDEAKAVCVSMQRIIADLMSSEELQRYLSGYRQTIQNFVQSLPTHANFLKTYCA